MVQEDLWTSGNPGDLNLLDDIILVLVLKGQGNVVPIITLKKEILKKNDRITVTANYHLFVVSIGIVMGIVTISSGYNSCI